VQPGTESNLIAFRHFVVQGDSSGTGKIPSMGCNPLILGKISSWEGSGRR
jgi:hypothetical protein